MIKVHKYQSIIRSFVRAFALSFVLSDVLSFVLSFILSFIHSFLQLLVYLKPHCLSFMHSQLPNKSCVFSTLVKSIYRSQLGKRASVRFNWSGNYIYLYGKLCPQTSWYQYLHDLLNELFLTLTLLCYIFDDVLF